MKLNKTLMIVALVAGGMFAADLAVLAQDSTNTPPPAARPPGGARGRMNFDNIATQLELTDDQKTKAKPIFQDMVQQMSDLRKDTTLQGADKRTKMTEIRDATTAKLKDILTPEQMTKWQQLMAGPRRAPGAAGTPPPAASTPPQQ